MNSNVKCFIVVVLCMMLAGVTIYAIQHRGHRCATSHVVEPSIKIDHLSSYTAVVWLTHCNTVDQLLVEVEDGGVLSIPEVERELEYGIKDAIAELRELHDGGQ